MHNSSPKVKPNHFDRLLVAGCSIGDKPCFLDVSERDMGKTIKSKYTLKYVFLKMVIDFSSKFGFNLML